MAPSLHFDGWNLDLDSGELTREGERIRLQEQPLRILQALLANPGRVVTREELVTRLWPRGIVDFETGLNTAMRRLRSVLREDADAPRYIETLPRRGYRFIGSVDEAVEQRHHELQTQLVGPGGAMVVRTECLVVVRSSQPAEVGRRYALTKGATSIGRGLENDIVLTGHSVSRQHTRIEMRGTEAFVVDTASTNGTFINDGKSPVRDCPLQSGDVLRIGDRSIAYLRGPDVEAQHRAVLARIAEVNPAALPEGCDSRG